MDDLVTIALLTASAFFAVLSVALLFRYRQVSHQIVTSNDLGRDLWSALESRMKRQDERILDMMGRVEVIQTRTLQQLASTESQPQGGPIIGGSVDAFARAPEQVPKGDSSEVTQSLPETSHDTEELDRAVSASNALEAQLKQQDGHIVDLIERIRLLESKFEERVSIGTPGSIREGGLQTMPVVRPFGRESVDKVSEKVLLEMLLEKPRTSVEIRERFGITREHAARVLKELFDKGIVVRNDSHKPFVYELTELGRRTSSPP